MTSPSRRNKRFTPLLLVLGVLLTALNLTGCSGQTDRMWLNAPDWSRAQFVGDTATGSRPVFALEPDNSATFLLVANEAGRNYPKAISFDGQGQKRWEAAYPEISMARPNKPRAYWAGGAVQAFWISNQQLYHVQLDQANGQLAEAPRKLSGDILVEDYAVAVDHQGRLVIWFAGPRIEPGLYRLPGYDLNGEPELVDLAGLRPSLAFDANDVLHAIWIHYPMGKPNITIFYTADALDGPGANDIHVVAEPKAAMGSLFSGPIMGLAASSAYIFWSIEIRTGVAAGSVNSRYLRFPLGRPQQTSKPTQLFVPSDYHLSYEEWLDAGFRAGRRAPFVQPRTGKVTHIYPHSSDLPELVTIQRERVNFTMRDSSYQIGTLFFDDGQPDSYQLLSFTGGDSRWPYITSDADRRLYAAWLERGAVDGFRIVYASTNPDIITTYATLSTEDYQTLAAQTLFGLVSSALLLPFVFMWMIAPIFLYLITFPLRRNQEGELTTGVLLSLGVSIAGYWITKLGFLGGLTGYAPFSAWLPIIPDWMALPLQIAVPATILGLGVLVAWRFTYKRQNPSSLLFLIFYLAVDGVLSAAIYGPVILATN